MAHGNKALVLSPLRTGKRIALWRRINSLRSGLSWRKPENISLREPSCSESYAAPTSIVRNLPSHSSRWRKQKYVFKKGTYKPQKHIDTIKEGAWSFSKATYNKIGNASVYQMMELHTDNPARGALNQSKSPTFRNDELNQQTFYQITNLIKIAVNWINNWIATWDYIRIWKRLSSQETAVFPFLFLKWTLNRTTATLKIHAPT